MSRDLPLARFLSPRYRPMTTILEINPLRESHFKLNFNFTRERIIYYIYYIYWEKMSEEKSLDLIISMNIIFIYDTRRRGNKAMDLSRPENRGVP